MRNVNVSRLEFDEIWQYVGKKRKAVKTIDPATVGDQYTFIALAGSAKAIVSYYTGKRTMEATYAFAKDVRARVLGAPEISTDGWRSYPAAIERAFNRECSHGVIVKEYAATEAVTSEAARRYSPGDVVAVSVERVIGNQVQVSTSYVERQNLTMRMQQRRFTRLTNAFSKKFENHCSAVALYAMHYNFCRVHEALRITPAMQLGVTDHVWSIRELIEAALDGLVPTGTTTEFPQNLDRADTVQSTRQLGEFKGRFTVIKGGRE
jgi:IS1 family transposase